MRSGIHREAEEGSVKTRRREDRAELDKKVYGIPVIDRRPRQSLFPDVFERSSADY
jgi:hypothetical protein